MLKNYITIAIRHLLKNKTFSLINILGLSSGIACCLLLSLYIADEFGYERHFQDYDRVYRMYTIFTKDGVPQSFPRVSPPIAMDLIDELPEIETATRVVDPPEVEVHLIRYNDKVFPEKNGYLVDSTFLDVFPYSLKEGDANTALDAPSSVLLSETLAEKIFGNKSPLDELLLITSGRARPDTFRVTGVIKQTPYHSHVDADFYMNMNSNGWGQYVLQNRTWAWNNFVGGYLKLRPGAHPATITAKLPELVDKYAGSDLKSAGLIKELGLQRLDAVRLYSEFNDSFGDTGSGGIKYVYILGSIGIFILLLACINFMNLTTAKASQRSGEVGVRKSMGANRATLVRQFIGESMIIVLVSLLIAVVLMNLALPLINQITGKDLGINSTNVMFIAGAMVAVGLVTGLIAGSYPAFFLSSFEPARVLRAKMLGGDGIPWLRRGLVVFQFVIAITLIASIIIVRQQLEYIQNKPLGFRPEHVVMIPLRNQDAMNQYLNIRQSFSQISGVKKVSACTSLPSTPVFRDYALYPQGSSNEKGVLHRIVLADEDYFSLLNIDLVAGRDFLAEKDTFNFERNDVRHIIVNEACLKEFNIDLKDAVGTTLFADYGTVNRHEIIGVVEDFHQFSLHQPIRPMFFAIPSGRRMYNYVTVSIDGGNYQETIQQMKTEWDKLINSVPFEHDFLAESVAKQYAADKNISLMLTWSTGLAILICCLGLYGLSIYVAERRIKEIGIRKVLGASVTNIVGMLSRDFIVLVMIAFVIAIPLGYYAMTNWLQNFEYRIELGYGVFVLAGVASFAIAWFTVGFESIRAALNNPVKSLRNE